MKIVSTLKCTEYDVPGHPESPGRVKETYNLLKKNGYEFIEPQYCRQEDILLVHSKDLLESVKKGTFLDADTPNIRNIFDYARLSVGAAIKASEIAKEERASFSLMRPPGHHATRSNLGGFCYFNNIAIAAKSALSKAKKVAVLDFDVHHGNGTEDIFLGDNRLLYLSLHQSPFYPGTGLKSTNNCINFPLIVGTGHKEYLKQLHQALDVIHKFKPELLGVSCGFDIYKDDPIGGLNLELDSFSEIGRLISQLEIPTFCILEGGYSQKLPYCILNFLEGFKL